MLGEGKGDILNFKVSTGHDKPSLDIFRLRDERLGDSDNLPILTCLPRTSSIVSKPPSWKCARGPFLAFAQPNLMVKK